MWTLNSSSPATTSDRETRSQRLPTCPAATAASRRRGRPRRPRQRLQLLQLEAVAARDKCRFCTQRAARAAAYSKPPPALRRAASSSTEIAPSGPWDGLLFELRGAALEANCGPQLDGAALEANLEQQREEDVALEAIYAQDVTITNAEVAATCALEVGAVVELAGGQERRLASLPPLSLRAWRPARYPSDAAPAFGLRCAWLSDAQLVALATRLDELWEEQGPGAGILLSWIEWLRHESAAFLFGDAAAGDALRISLVPTDGGALLDPADAVAASGGRRA